MTAPLVWTWNPKRYKIARLLGEGERVEDVALICDVGVSTIRQWMCGCKEFHDYIDEVTAEQELVTRRGMMRACLKIAEGKIKEAKDDKDTALAYLKFMNDITEDAPDTNLTVTFR